MSAHKRSLTETGLTFLLGAVLIACQVAGPTLPAGSPSPARFQATPTQRRATAPAVATAAVTPAPSGQALPPFTLDWTRSFGGVTLTTWIPQTYAGENIALPLGLDRLANGQVLAGLTPAQKTFLAQNGFVINHSQEAQFGDIRVETASRTGQAYYLTTDAAFHALHLHFDDMLKTLEREYFRPRMLALTRATVQEVQSALPQVRGSALEAETRQALAYLSVALKLFDPAADIDPTVAELVTQQVDQIVAADGRGVSVIFPDFEDDYGAYKPVGHYVDDPDLEAYFRGMTWFGRMHFRLQDPEQPNFVPSRVPLIVTLALRRAQLDAQPASTAWAGLHETLTFVVGPSDDAGPLEYAALMDEVYGNAPTFLNLAEAAPWQAFLARSDQLPAPQINSLFVDSTRTLAPTQGWRFMGQRFTLDGLIFQNVIFDKVQAKPDGTRRKFPSGLDVMAVWGSAPALQELDRSGATGFPNYSEQMTKLQQVAQAQPEAEWLGRFYDGWLYAFFPLVQPKAAAYPAYMQTAAWSYKDLNTALGSWAELKHDTILYTKMPEMAGGGGPPMSFAAPSYVEPDPVVFYRLAYIARQLSCGLQERVLGQPCGPGGLGRRPRPDIEGYIMSLFDLGDRFEALGDIAVQELTGQPVSSEMNASITDCLGMPECLNLETPYSQAQSEMPKVPVVAAVSGADTEVLEVGVGNVDRIYVVVPLEGRWQVAQGGVFSYYEFTQPRAQRLTDAEWREKLAAGGVALPVWADNFVLAGGQAAEWLAFRKGDVYILSSAGDNLNVRDSASLAGMVVRQLKTGDYVEIIDGPLTANGYTWWQIKEGFGDTALGWVVEDQQWYERSYMP